MAQAPRYKKPLQKRPAAGKTRAKKTGFWKKWFSGSGKSRVLKKTNGGLKRSRLSKKTRRRSFLGGFIRFCLTCFILGIFAMGGLIAYYASYLPPIDTLAVPKRPPNISILASDGSLLANRGETGGQNIRIEDLPPYLPNAFIAIEDRRFRKHFGIDPKGIFRAVYQNILRKGVSMQGGSTITQQLAKNIFLTQERTMSRKIQEAILSVWLERNYSKDKILELYLNRVYFGAGAYGIEAASRRYFNKSAMDVSLAEAAVLAGLVQAPSRLAPNRNPKAAQARAEKVLDALSLNKLAPDRMIVQARKNPAKAVRSNVTGEANYAADYVMDILDDFVGSIDSDIFVFTTIDRNMQRQAEKVLSNGLNEKGSEYKVSQGALVAMTPGGAIRAVVGGRDYAASQFNRAVAARRQPGSSFKPFVYLTALEQGAKPDDIRVDEPVKFGNWAPQNASRTYYGAVSLREALAYSLNTIAVILCTEVGPKNVVATARRLGIASPMKANATIALGTSEVTPLEMATAFSAFANGGYSVVPYIITQVSSADNKLIYKKDKVLHFGQVISPPVLSMLNDMLNASFEIGTARSGFIPGWQVAGKTGTTQDWRDAWFVGYTGSLVTAVWIGNDDNSPTRRASGSNLPLAIWNAFMKEALKGLPVIPLPGGPWDKSRYEEKTEQVVQEPSDIRSGRHPSAPEEGGFLGNLFRR